MRLSLYWKILIAFAVVITVTISVVIVAAGQATRSELHTYVAKGRVNRLAQIAADLGEFYATQKSWDNVQDVLLATQTSGGGRGQGGGRFGNSGSSITRLRVADEQNTIVADTNSADIGHAASRSELQNGAPIIWGNQQIGTLLANFADDSLIGQQEQEFLTSINQGLILAGLAAAFLALLVGFLIFRSITAPLGKLTTAAQAIAQGNLAVQVETKSGDEIARLGQTFNNMTASLQQAALQRRNMMADIAHELRTPLSVIQGNIEAIRDGIYPADAEHLDPTLDQAHLLARLVEDLRTLALAESGQLALDRQATDAGTLIERIVASFGATASNKKITLSTHLPAHPLPPAYIDSQRISQVLGNLIENALRYTPEKGSITIGAQLVANTALQISVTDSGPGIAAEDLPHVFDRFYRADKSRSRASGGSGLGLAIAKSIIEAHNGTIYVESAPGHGATFKIELPLQAAGNR